MHQKQLDKLLSKYSNTLPNTRENDVNSTFDYKSVNHHSETNSNIIDNQHLRMSASQPVNNNTSQIRNNNDHMQQQDLELYYNLLLDGYGSQNSPFGQGQPIYNKSNNISKEIMNHNNKPYQEIHRFTKSEQKCRNRGKKQKLNSQDQSENYIQNQNQYTHKQNSINQSQQYQQQSYQQYSYQDSQQIPQLELAAKVSKKSNKSQVDKYPYPQSARKLLEEENSTVQKNKSRQKEEKIQKKRRGKNRNKDNEIVYVDPFDKSYMKVKFDREKKARDMRILWEGAFGKQTRLNDYQYVEEDKVKGKSKSKEIHSQSSQTKISKSDQTDLITEQFTKLGMKTSKALGVNRSKKQINNILNYLESGELPKQYLDKFEALIAN